MRFVGLILVLACGCTHEQTLRAHRIGEIAAGGGVIGMMAAGAAPAFVPSHDTGILEAGLVFVPVTVIGALVYISTDRAASGESPTFVTERQRAQAAAWDLTREAETAARGRDCSRVAAIGPRVRDLDPDFHEVVFMRDVAIRRCLRARAR